MELLTNFFSTTDPIACRDHLLRETGTHRFEVVPQSQFSVFSHQSVRLGHLSLHRVNFSGSDNFRIRKSIRGSYFAFQFVVAGCVNIDDGNGQHGYAEPGDIFVLTPDRVTREEWSDEYSVLTVRIEQEDIENAIAEAILPRQSQIPFKLVYRDPGIAAWLNQALRSFDAGQESAGALLRDDRVSHHLSQSLMMMLLTGLDNNASAVIGHLVPRFAPYYVRRVEKFFENNFADEITMDEVVEVSGVSARSVFYGFQRWRNTTPMNYLRDLRLDIARKELRRGCNRARTVSSAALTVGFTNFSQFSRLYRARYGEKPWATVLQARAQRLPAIRNSQSKI